MASNQPPAQEFLVRLPANNSKRYSIMKFGRSSKIDFTTCGQAKIERENNFREFKQANDLETMPKYGAGSEYGRDQKDEARRKKYGIYLKKYNPEKQPWLLKMGTGKEAKKYKGVKEGGVNENASYYIFTQSSGGAFEASPVEEWFNFTPQINYKYLNAEEAEEKFSRRNQTLNYFSIMLEKKLQTDHNDDGDGDGEEKKSKGKKSKGKNSFLLTDMDEWDALSEGDGSDSDEEGKEAKPKKKGKGKKKLKEKKNSDDEALEESDDLDEGNEVDYMTDSDSEDEDMYKEKDREEDNKYQEKGVEDEDGLRNVLNSDDEEEQEEKKDENEEEEEEEEDKKTKKEGDSDSESSSSSDSDSDPEKDPNFSSALFMQKGKKKKESSAENTPSNSRSVTPTVGENSEDKAKKRKAENASPAPGKKAKMETSAGATSTPITSGSSDGISDEAVRRYLMRKPMTTKDLLQKFKSKNTGLSKEQLVTTIAQILKRLNPERNKTKDKLYLYIKPK